MKIALPPEIAATIREHPAFAQELTRLAEDMVAGRIAENSAAIDDFVARVRAATKPSPVKIKDINDLGRREGPGPVQVVIANAHEVAAPTEPAQPAATVGKSPPHESESPPPPPTDRAGDVVHPSRVSDDCPIKPLGDDETFCYYLDPAGRQIALEATQHGRLHLMKLFGDQQCWLEEHYPRRRFVKDKLDTTDKGAWITVGVHWERVAEHLMAAAHRKGFWQPHRRVRHAGTWSADGDREQLFIHCGDVVLERNPRGGFIEHRPGLIGHYLYPARPPLLRPYHLPVAAGDRRITRIHETLGNWNLLGGEFDSTMRME